MRGKVEPYRRTAAYLGITPAYAGKSFQLGDVPAVQKDHPRLCGEKVEQRNIVIDTIGSPPPMRGKGNLENWIKTTTRITPAYAGKRSSRCSAMHRRRDHPRLCGEKVSNFHSLEFAPGSPPPMRGKAHKAAMTLHRSGITPAYAGKSGRSYNLVPPRQDHPRLCGEKHRG